MIAATRIYYIKTKNSVFLFEKSGKFSILQNKSNQDFRYLNFWKKLKPNQGKTKNFV